MNLRVGLGFDVHPFGGQGRLVLGGVELDGPSLLGHSDADVVVHAVADALLGAAGLPDLGALFPAADERYRGADSMELLGEVAARVAREGWRVVNVDVAVVAERPRLAPHLPSMVANLGQAMGKAVRVGCGLQPVPGGSGVTPGISVKPKRAEGLGAIGRGEGIAAWAVALLERAEPPADGQ